MALRVRVDGTPHALHVLHGHPEHRQLVQLPGHGVTHGYHAGQFRDVRVHLVPTPFLDLAVVVPVSVLINSLLRRVTLVRDRNRHRAQQNICDPGRKYFFGKKEDNKKNEPSPPSPSLLDLAAIWPGAAGKTVREPDADWF